MRFLRTLLWALPWLLLVEGVRADPCVQDMVTLVSPAPVPLNVGVADVHTYKVGRQRFPSLVSIYTPTSLDRSTKIWDFQLLGFDDKLPKQFVMSDGGSFGSFYYFDLRPESSLRKRSKRYIAVLREEYLQGSRGLTFKEFVLESLVKEHRFETDLFLTEALEPEMRTNYFVGEEAESILKSFLDRPFTGPNPIITQSRRNSVPFLAAYDPSRTRMCFEKSWIAGLILEEAGIPHRMRFGQSALYEPNSVANNGHLLIELKDGRLLDVEWNTLVRGRRHPRFRDWRFIETEFEGDTPLWWSPYKHYPGLIIAP